MELFNNKLISIVKPAEVVKQFEYNFVKGIDLIKSVEIVIPVRDFDLYKGIPTVRFVKYFYVNEDDKYGNSKLILKNNKKLF